MRASLNLLKRFIDLEGLTPEYIADKLTFAGLEVEGIERLASASNLVIGEIVECVEHPSSDHLHVLKVNLGDKYGVEQIVCGAPNARKGLKVIVARVGAELKKINLTISKGIIRGVESNGMCCSLSELGVDKSFLTEYQLSGIEELDENAPVGEENVLEYLGLDDVILDINVLANRSDCLAIFSLVKELSALLSRDIKIPEPKKYKEEVSPLKVSSLTESCPQFSIKLVKDIKVKPSPSWLSASLMSQGIRSINNVVDIGNYIMLLTGQPIHMYDLDKLDSDSFVVRDDYECDFVALDEKTYQVTNGDIVITNGDKIGCLGGVMGALYCVVDENSKNIAIESANFTGSVIRRTTVKTGLSSDSSARFIKGINPYQDRFVLDLAAQLLVELADAKVVYETVRYSSLADKPNDVECTYSYINKRLGYHFEKDEIKNVLNSLNIKVTDIDEDKFVVSVPEHRIDIKCNADLCEEVFRFIGLDRIQPKLPNMVTTVGGLTKEQLNKKKIREHLISQGLHEVLTYTLVSPELDDKFVVLNNDEYIKIMNPMTVEHSIVRRGLISSLIEVVNYNISHQNKDVAIFETSDITTKNQRYQELCVVLTGNKFIRSSLVKELYSYYDISGVFESICLLLGIDAKRYRLSRLNDKHFHPGRSAEILFGKERVGVIGELHPLYSKGLGRVYVLDINLSKFLSLKCSQTKMQKISKFPSVERDYAFVLKREILAEDVIRAIKKESHGIISDVNIFDVYEGEFLPNGYKSLAVKIKFTSFEKTLKDDEINSVENAVLSTLNKLYGAYLRN